MFGKIMLWLFLIEFLILELVSFEVLFGDENGIMVYVVRVFDGVFVLIICNSWIYIGLWFGFL